MVLKFSVTVVKIVKFYYYIYIDFNIFNINTYAYKIIKCRNMVAYVINNYYD